MAYVNPNDVEVVILAGGRGERLYPLTKDRAKPAVPFGGMYRIIDFTLSNCVNSGLKKIYVLSQYKSHSLNRHIQRGWLPFFSYPMGEFIYDIPAQQRIGSSWYEGTADAVFQNIYSLQQTNTPLTLILSGDHVYQMDYREMIGFHLDTKADVTIGVVAMPVETASQFGVVRADEAMRVVGFQEKPKKDPYTMPGDRSKVLVSMGIYVFHTSTLIRRLVEDAKLKTSSHDFGKDIIPRMVKNAAVMAFPFKDIMGESYWRDIGTLDAYYEANMDLVSVTPKCNLYHTSWPVHTVYSPYPPSKMVFAGGEDGKRIGQVLDSIVCGGSIVSGGRVERSIISPNVRVNSYAEIEDSILMEGVEVGRHCRIRRTIVDKRVKIPPRTTIGYDAEEDARRFDISPGGIVVVPKNTVFD
ncbi:MAG TPA: glucose-1-phosphate adenylyltransferase [Deltaproteobacteria bacterium]|nr:glucose-1-phosphate adenylyltransferase [Deltaproteobacteria bacterium]HOM28087.1 glucose-1-phosphate adenylyltransferase [Deltaproteobacteria bacterium]HPP80530.1 glucose-1-phosphate adenylyltransferase [Deltaproteobacteria bacterium]